MKPSHFVLSTLLLFLVLWGVSLFHTPSSKADQRLASKHQPWDDFIYQRAYPDQRFAYQKYMTEMGQAETDRRAKSTGVAGELMWQSEGPANIGGRINKITVDYSNPAVLYAGNASGGIFKTTDTGASWFPVFDGHPYLAIGDIVLDPQNPSTVYAGTGDPNVSGYPFMGNGIYRSPDGGNTWAHLGLAEASIVSRIIVHPTDSNLLWVATMGLPFVRNIHRGVYRSADGGQTWLKVLYINNETGIADMVIDPVNPDILYAAGWTRIRNNSESLGYGSGAKIFKSVDGGLTWTQLTGGLPTTAQSRIGLAISTSNPSVLYASYVGVNYELFNLYKTTNGGTSWTALGVTSDIQYNMGGFGWYFGKIRVSPTNPDEIFLLVVDLYKYFNYFI
jgi:photosystem II stability/assembly factor-like uncharacterized protein